MLTSVAEAASCQLQITAFVDFVLIALPTSQMPSCFQCLAESCSRLLAGFRESISELETQVRMCQKRTLLSLLDELLPWFQRLDVVATLLLQTSSAQLATLQYNGTAVLFLNRLELLSYTFVSSTTDEMISGFIQQLYATCLVSYLGPCMRILYGRSILTDVKLIPFLRLALPSIDHPDFWQLGITICPDAIPIILQNVLPNLVTSVKSLLLLRSIASSFPNLNLLRKLHQIKSPTVLFEREINPLPEEHTEPQPNKNHTPLTCLLADEDAEFCALVSHLQLEPAVVNKPLSLPSLLSGEPVVTRKYKQRLENSIKAHSDNVSLLLASSLRDEGEASLTYSLTLLSNTLLFRGGCQMHDFCNRLFSTRWCSLTVADDLEINEMLQTCLNTDADVASLTHQLRLSIVREEDDDVNESSCFFQRLTASFAAPWPLNIVITPSVLKTYTGVFTFLLVVC